MLPATSPRNSILAGICVPKLSLPLRLALLVAGTTLPLIIFAAVIVFSNYEQDRRDASQRVGETVRHAIADILSQGSVHDPDLEGHIITVPEVRMSPDLKLATVYVMPLGGRDTDKVIAEYTMVRSSRRIG